MPCFRHIFSAAVFCRIFFLSVAACSQTTDKAFSGIDVGFDMASVVSQNTLNELWDPAYGMEAYIRMPFYWGDIEANAGLFQYTGREDASLDFNSILTWIGWGKSVQATGSLYLFAGALIGNSYMSFARDGFLKKGESELTAGLYSRVSYAVDEHWKVHLSAKRTRTYTYKRINMTYIAGGFSRHFTAPGWLKTFLK